MLLVVDTNVIVNALITKSTGSKSYLLIKDILNGKHKMCVSTDIMSEYEDVLKRPHLGIDIVKVEWFLSWIRIHSIWIEPRPSDSSYVEMKDEDDRVFFDVARCLNIRLVTHNYKDYPVHELITLIDELY